MESNNDQSKNKSKKEREYKRYIEYYKSILLSKKQLEDKTMPLDTMIPKISEYDTLIESISERIAATKLRPLYFGKVEDFGGPPRTYFEGGFSKGTRSEDEDDEDGDHSKGYKRMRR